MKPEPLILSRNCRNCQHFDGDCHCSLARIYAPIYGAIVEPALVVCTKHEPKEADDEG